MTRRMHDPEFAAEQRSGLYDPHVAPVNQLVDRLMDQDAHGWAAHVAPLHGGTKARMLWLLRDPGPKTVDPNRPDAGFLCVENDDATAARLCELLEIGGIDPGDTLPWNAYPWFINRAPTRAELRTATASLIELVTLLEDVEVVLLLGEHAQHAWTLLERAWPDLANRLQVLATRHTSRQAFIGNAEQRATWRADQEGVFRQAGQLLRTSSRSVGPRTRDGEAG